MKHLDMLFERLRQFDETTLLELLDITSDEILERFRDVVIRKRDVLFGEVELFIEDDEDYVDELDGFQVEYIGFGEDTEDGDY